MREQAAMITGSEERMNNSANSNTCEPTAGRRFAEMYISAMAWLVLLPGSAYAAVVDCGKTSSKTEAMICSNPELEWLDRQMTERYRISLVHNEVLLRLLKRTEEEIAEDRQRVLQVKQSQDEWLQKRDACENDACLLDAYYSRLSVLLSPALKQAIKQVPRFKTVEGKGWAVCDAYAKFLNALPDNEPLPLFDLRLAEVPGMKEVRGEELDIQKNLPLLYAVEQQLRGHKKWPPPKDFDEWKQNLEWRIKAGFKPRLRKIKATIAKGLSSSKQQELREAEKNGAKDHVQRIRDADATDAPLDTFLAYEEDVTSYQAQIKLYRSVAIGAWLLRFDETSGKLSQDGLPTMFVLPMYVVTFQGSPYLVSQFVGSDASPGHAPYIGGNIGISRLQRYYESESRDGPTHYLSEDFCRIFYQYPEFQKR